MTKVEAQAQAKPRRLSAWEKQVQEAGRAVLAAVEEIANDPALRRLCLCAAQFVGEAFGYQVIPKDDMDARYVLILRAEFESDGFAPFRELAKRLEERKTALAHMAGPLLPEWLRWIIAREMLPAGETRLPDKIYRFLPDNPITAETAAALKGTAARHLLQVHALLIRPGQPARAVGRPRGTSRPSKSGKGEVSPDLALSVYHAKGRRMPWQKIVRQVLNLSLPSDHKARERLRARVRYLHAVGARLDRQKVR